ncbi:hypothetical protein N0K81_15505 [Shigella sonnei]|nr:hypothetical protein [Shigella sonnei]
MVGRSWWLVADALFNMIVCFCCYAGNHWTRWLSVGVADTADPVAVIRFLLLLAQEMVSIGANLLMVADFDAECRWRLVWRERLLSL